MKITKIDLILLLITILNIVAIIFQWQIIWWFSYDIKIAIIILFFNEKIKLNLSENKDLDFVIKFFNNTLNTLKNIKEEFLHWKEIKWEVSLAKEIQWKTFTKKLKEIPSLNVVAKSKPAWEIWWDSYDIIQNNDNYYIYVWDATWHWVWAWLIMMMVNALVSGFSKVYEKWSDILIKTNEILLEHDMNI